MNTHTHTLYLPRKQAVAVQRDKAGCSGPSLASVSPFCEGICTDKGSSVCQPQWDSPGNPPQQCCSVTLDWLQDCDYSSARRHSKEPLREASPDDTGKLRKLLTFSPGVPMGPWGPGIPWEIKRTGRSHEKRDGQ